MLAISLVFKSLLESLLFFGGFYLYRKIAGGYHADTYLKCHIIFAVNQILFIIILYMYPTTYRYFLVMSVCVICTVVTILFAPIDHANKPFDSKEICKYKKLSILFCGVLIPAILKLQQQQVIMPAV